MSVKACWLFCPDFSFHMEATTVSQETISSGIIGVIGFAPIEQPYSGTPETAQCITPVLNKAHHEYFSL
jgi:hypothetical protein